MLFAHLVAGSYSDLDQFGLASPILIWIRATQAAFITMLTK
jgi:hypothetical protein